MAVKYTHICVILDRSGSMESIREDTVGGFNAFVEQQRQVEGMATLSLVQFDSQDPFEVLHEFVPLRDAPRLTREQFVPRGSTPLLDAIGRTINHTEAHLAKMADFTRPDAVIIAIITDGQENASHEFKRADIQKMIKAKEELLGWKFVFLSADLNAVSDAVDDGVAPSRTMAFAKSARGTQRAWRTLSEKLSDVRSGRAPDMDFTDEQQKDS